MKSENQLTLIMAQLNFMLGDITNNAKKIISTAKHCRDELQADIVVFPELAITGYPPEDLLLRPEFNRKAEEALKKVCQEVTGIYLVIGFPHQTSEGLYNAAAIIYNGEIIKTYHKYHLPNYSVFDEKRYFISPKIPEVCLVTIKNTKIAVTICEDIWQCGPFSQAVNAGAEMMICINSSPFHFNKPEERVEILRQRQREEGKIPIVYVNCVGGQDELVFDGGSIVMDDQGKVSQLAPFFKESLEQVKIDLTKKPQPVSQKISPALSTEQTFYEALVLGTRDYIQKNNFKGALLGLSGGIDSALTLCVAADAIGSENICAVMMPSRYTADISLDDAKALAENLKVKTEIISIEPSFQAFLTSLSPLFKNFPPDVAEENIQARCRGILLMALSNKWGHIVLTTGNKSELAVGYSTLYGDLAGGFAVIKDCPKTMVYRLAHYRNQIKSVIPQRIIDRAPSAELSANQTDQDTLPPYDILDKIIFAYVENNQSIEEITAQGIDSATVHKVAKMIDRSEYKRRQSPPGIRLSKRAFGRDWRYPITSGFKRGEDRR